MSRSFGSRSFTSRSPMKMFPPVSSTRPAIRLSVVVLPQPDGPTNATNSPSSMVRDRWSTAWNEPYVLTTSLSRTCAIRIAAACLHRHCKERGGARTCCAHCLGPCRDDRYHPPGHTLCLHRTFCERTYEITLQ